MGRIQVRQLLSFLLVIALLSIFTGCGSVSGNQVTNNPSPTPTPTGTPSGPTPTPTPTPTLVSRFIYGTPGFESGSIQAGAILGDGSVTPVVGSPFGEGLGQPSIIQITADSRGRFVYVLNVEASAVGMLIGNPGIGGFKVDQQTGALTAVPGSPIVFPAGNDNLLAVDGTDHFVFEPNGQGNLASSGFDVYLIDQNTGALTKTTSTSNTPPVGSFSIASPNGQFLFNAGNGQVAAFSIVSPTGQLLAVAGTPLSTIGSAGPMAITADSKFLYVANQVEGTVTVFTVSSGGALSVVAGSPFAIDPGAQFIKLTPDARFLYVAAFNSANAVAPATVKGYSVNPAVGAFVPITGAIVNNANSFTLDQQGKFAFISVPGTLFTYGIDPVTGALTQLSHTTAPSSDDANDLIAVP
ncbi:MAG TPA: beta-propeller fold lactonase family protein [Candidatus Angelobacter sp.]|nr:beta-propeller fold lactonase family protein [Candidatus Angelobacter sp.]